MSWPLLHLYNSFSYPILRLYNHIKSPRQIFTSDIVPRLFPSRQSSALRNLATSSTSTSTLFGNGGHEDGVGGDIYCPAWRELSLKPLQQWQLERMIRFDLSVKAWQAFLISPSPASSYIFPLNMSSWQQRREMAVVASEGLICKSRTMGWPEATD